MQSDHRRHWTLQPELVFLNHGSYGACPRVVLERQSELRAQLEASPVQFMLRLPRELQRTRQIVALFLGVQPDNLAFVGNATAAVNAVIRSLPLSAGDEILACNHAYPACLNALRFAAAERGASVRVVDVPFPIARAEQIIEAFSSGITPRTRLALVDHVTSATALVFPRPSAFTRCSTGRARATPRRGSASTEPSRSWLARCREAGPSCAQRTGN